MSLADHQIGRSVSAANMAETQREIMSGEHDARLRAGNHIYANITAIRPVRPLSF